MSVPQLERTYVNNLIKRCPGIFFSRIESMTSVGFPDLVMIRGNRLQLAEAKVVHSGDWLYVRNTQMAWGHKSQLKGYDVPFFLGMAGSGMGFFRFSALLSAPHQDYKMTHKRFKVYDIFNMRTAAKSDNWEAFIVTCVFT